MNTLAISALALVGLLEAVLLWWLVRGLRHQRRLEDRVAHLGDALSLLTETSEAGFRASAAEIGRLAQIHAVPRRRPATGTPAGTRVARARARGKSVEQIAAEEEMSEGEAHLWMRLQEGRGRRGAASSHVCSPAQDAGAA